MRFAVKTSPQDTTWDAILAVWREADDIGVFESGWVSDHLPAGRGPVRSQAGAAAAPAGLHRRQRPSAHLAHRRPVRAALELRRRLPQEFSQARDVLQEHCAAIGRDPASILLSGQVRHTGDPAQTAAAAADFAAAGAGLAVIYLPPPHSQAVLGPLASALSRVP